MIDPKIKTLLTLINIGSYTKTAKILNLTQPAVSHHIKLLEEEFGIKIFYKDRKTLKPTPEGEILIKYAKRASALSTNVRLDLEACKKSMRRITIGITPTAEGNLVSQIFTTYCNEHPNIHINIITDTINNIYNLLKSYELDLAIVEGNIPDSSYTSILLDTDYLCLAVSPKHRFAKRKSVSLHELKSENFILRSQKAGTRLLFENHLLSHSENIKNFNVTIELDNVATIKELVASNLGVTIIAHSAVKDEETSGKLIIVPIENMNMIREINIVHLSDFQHMEILDDIRRVYNSCGSNKSDYWN